MVTDIDINQKAKLIDKNLKLFKQRIAEAAEKAGRVAGPIKIITLRKRMP